MKFTDKRGGWGPEPRIEALKAYKRPIYQREMIVIAGPCSVESGGHAARMSNWLSEPVLWDNKLGGARKAVTFARGGLFRAGTYPRPGFGLKRSIMKSWSRAVRQKGLQTIVEVIDMRQIEEIEPYADAFQVGARHCQDYALLKELAKFNRTVTLKRNMGMTLFEWLGAAEYLAQGRCNPVLIERGSATHMEHVRWDLNLSVIPAIKRIGLDIPVIVDASHGTGRRDLVEDMTMAGIGAGADGFLIEVHDNPRFSLSDADQAVDASELRGIIYKAMRVRRAIK